MSTKQVALCLLWISLAHGYLGQHPSSIQAHFRAIDCTNPTRFRTTTFKQVCQHRDISPPQPVEAVLLQHLTNHRLSAIRCERRVTMVQAVCAVWSHSKLLQALDVQRLEPFGAEECRRAVETKLYAPQDGNVIPFDFNKELQYKRTVTGSLYATPNDVRCIGGSGTVGGKLHSDLITLATYTVIFKEIELELDTVQHRLIDLDAHVEIDVDCATKAACQDGAMGFVLTHRESFCPFVILKAGQLEIISLMAISGEKVDGILARAEKSLFRLGREVPSPSCLNYGSVRRTNHKDIFVLYPEDLDVVKTALPFASGKDVDLELEITSSEAYLEYRFLSSSARYLGSSLRAICSLGLYNLPSLMPSPIHSDRFLMTNGEVLTEVQCTNVTVSVTFGSTPVPWCAKDLLPVKYENHTVFLQANTRLIVPDVPDVLSNCTTVTSPIFISEEGTIVTATPEIKEAKIVIQQEGLRLLDTYFDNTLEGEDDFGKSLIYDHHAMQEMNANLQYGITKKKVLSSLTKAYCSEEGSCGSYSPTEESNFNINNLLEHAEERFNLGSQVYNKLVEIGSFLSIFIAAYYIGVLVCWVLKKTMPGIIFTKPAWVDRIFKKENERALLQDLELNNLLADKLADRAKSRINELRLQDEVAEHDASPSCPLTVDTNPRRIIN